MQFCMRERVRPASGPARSGCGRPVAAWLGPIEREEGAVRVGIQTPPPEPPHVCRPLPLRAAAGPRLGVPPPPVCTVRSLLSPSSCSASRPPCAPVKDRPPPMAGASQAGGEPQGGGALGAPSDPQPAVPGCHAAEDAGGRGGHGCWWVAGRRWRQCGPRSVRLMPMSPGARSCRSRRR